MNFIDLNFSSKLLNDEGIKVLSVANDLVLESHGHGCGFLQLEGKHIGTVVFVFGRDYLPEEECCKSYSDANMIVDESDSNIDISFFVNGGVFNYVIEKIAVENVLYFKLDGKKFTLSRKKLVNVIDE